MKILVSFVLAMAAGFHLNGAAAQTGEECSKSALSSAAIEQLDIYDKDLYLETACTDGTTPLPVHCNYMGIGQQCRGCFLTCDGVSRYLEDFSAEYAVWGEAIINFCSDAEAENMDDCM